MKQILLKVFFFGVFAFTVTAMDFSRQPLGIGGITGIGSTAYAKSVEKPEGPTKPERPLKPISVPEPSSLSLMGVGVAGVGMYTVWKRRKK